MHSNVTITRIPFFLAMQVTLRVAFGLGLAAGPHTRAFAVPRKELVSADILLYVCIETTANRIECAEASREKREARSEADVVGKEEEAGMTEAVGKYT